MNNLFNELLSDCILMFRLTVDKKRVCMYILIPKEYKNDTIRDMSIKKMINSLMLCKKEVDNGGFGPFPKDLKLSKRFYRIDYREPSGRFHIGSNVNKIYQDKYSIVPIKGLCFVFNCSFDSEDNLILSDYDLSLAASYVQIFTSIKAY